MGYGAYTQDLIDRLAAQGDPEAGPLHPEEVPDLIVRLQARLGDDGTALDRSPTSLKRLEQRLIKYHADLQTQSIILSDEDQVRLVRELTAYIGSVLITQLGGVWHQDTPSLMRTSVFFAGPFKIIKDRRYVSPVGVNFVLGWEAAWTWDQLMEGQPISLYKIYRQARSRRIKEQLPDTDL
jgi:hypothetical protein